jgi:hypothetical protein
MVQSGIAYAAGQLLAVVAPRTVLVVDAPTDWSLAGPLWELALDDAPVDEILDVLIRRGIRTAPSFAIVRVENDAVRALVRGSVPVCFERVGEPVRLDATGATTWLEGLISSARRVLVGAVETNSTLPFLVSTGVVLVSGLALPCGPSASTDSGVITPGIAEPREPDGGGTPADSSYFSRASASPAVPAGGAYTPAGREPRVVDLTRSGGRAPAKAYASSSEPRDSWALNSGRNGDNGGSGSAPRADLNGHNSSAPVSPAYDANPPYGDDPLNDSASRSESAPPASTERSSLAEPTALRSEPAPTAEPRYDPIDFSKVSADDPGELQDLDSPSQFGSSSSATSTTGAEQGYGGLTELPRSYTEPDAASRTSAPADDLLTDPEDDEPEGPSPVDLPKLESQPLAAPPLSPNGFNGVNGRGVPIQPRGFGGAPAAWPPLFEPDAAKSDRESAPSRPDSTPEPASFAEESRYPEPSDASARSGFEPGDRHDNQGKPDAPNESGQGSSSSMPAFLPPLPSADDRAAPGELPLRVRGSSLRPEHQRPSNGNRMPGAAESERPAPASPQWPVESRFGDPSDANGDDQASPSEAPPVGGDGPASGKLLLPAFFRGARTARKPGSDDADAPGAPDDVEDESESAAPSSWLQEPPSSSQPDPWVAPVRRGTPPPSAPPASFNGGPPAMPSVLRPAFGGNPQISDQDEYDDEDDEPTEATPGPMNGSDDDDLYDSGQEPPREPPRLLGVWCDAGHVTSTEHDECRVCGLPVPPQAPILVARPPLGVLIFDNGDRVMVDRPIVVGRDPKQVASPDPETPVLHPVPSATGQVSRTHAEIRADGWDVILTDLDAMNGTALTLPGSAPIAIEPGVPTVITPGARVDLGGESGFVFEIDA